jgi:AraC family transcriptional activator of pobA
VGVRNCEFVRDKYGRELLIDVAWVRDMPGFIQDDEPHTTEFYDITLVTGGRGTFRLDSASHPVQPGRMLFTTPGQVRRWEVEGLDGLCLFFTAEFIHEFFSDPLFLHRLRFFHADDARSTLRLDENQSRDVLASLVDMEAEISSIRADSDHALRAGLYQLLVQLNRVYVRAHGLAPGPRLSLTVVQFGALVENHFTRMHRLEEYCRLLAVTPGHLSSLTRRYLGRPAGAVIRNRLLVEAKRRLLFSDTTAEKISLELGFKDPAYFSRFFKRGTGRTPTQFRAGAR